MTITPHYLYIETVGCQMNVLDSEMVVASLRRHGYQLVDSVDQADTILFNTCSVRQHAEDKTYSALGRLRRHKQRSPEKIIGVLGCMAQKDQRLIFERAPYVDLVVGPGQLQQTAELIERANMANCAVILTTLGSDPRVGQTPDIELEVYGKCATILDLNRRRANDVVNGDDA